MQEGAPKKRVADHEHLPRRDFLRQALAAALAPTILSWDGLHSSAHALNVPRGTSFRHALDALFKSAETEKFESLAYILHHPALFSEGSAVDIRSSIAKRDVLSVSGKGIQLFFNILFAMQGHGLTHESGTTVIGAHTHTKAGHRAIFDNAVIGTIENTGKAYVGIPSTTDLRSTALQGLRSAHIVLAHHDPAFSKMPAVAAVDLAVTNAGVYITRAPAEYPETAIKQDEAIPAAVERAWKEQNIAWLLFVNQALANALSWNEILSSPEYQQLQLFVYTNFGVHMEFAPKERVTIAIILGAQKSFPVQ